MRSATCTAYDVLEAAIWYGVRRGHGLKRRQHVGGISSETASRRWAEQMDAASRVPGYQVPGGVEGNRT
ncbi:MAG TPA: hypothetical protein PLM33_04160 [Acidobacteriota bacterium]|nr:hypothetical protein [Acidobacteriota bacterium]HRR26332.1 hypothetical protein [Acidobacteriota bacterium]